MLHHLIVFYLVVDCCLFGSFACAFFRPIRVHDETFVTAPDAERNAELMLENIKDQQQGKHLLDHSYSYLNS